MISVPSTKVYVDQKYLTAGKVEGFFEPGYWCAVKMNQHKAMECTVLLETGALFGGLPLSALRSSDRNGKGSTDLGVSNAQFWSCLTDSARIIEISLLRRMACEVRLKSGAIAGGYYLFTLDPFGPGSLADTPDEYKSYNIIALDHGHIVAYPNNRIRFADASLTDWKNTDCSHYKVNTREWLIEESGIKNDGTWSY